MLLMEVMSVGATWFVHLFYLPKMLPLLYTPFGNLVVYISPYVVNWVINPPHSDVSYFYDKCCNVLVTPCWSCMSCKMWMIRGPLRAPDRLSELYDSHVQLRMQVAAGWAASPLGQPAPQIHQNPHHGPHHFSGAMWPTRITQRHSKLATCLWDVSWIFGSDDLSPCCCDNYGTYIILA